MAKNIRTYNPTAFIIASGYNPTELMTALDIANYVGSKNKHCAAVLTRKEPTFPGAVLKGNWNESYWLAIDIKRWVKETGFKLKTKFGAGKATQHETVAEREVAERLRAQHQLRVGTNRQRREPLLMTYAPPLASPYYKGLSGWKQAVQKIRPDSNI